MDREYSLAVGADTIGSSWPLLVSERTDPSAAKRRSWHELSSIYTKRQEALPYMRKAIVLFALSIAVCGCNKHGGQPRLESLERGLAEACCRPRRYRAHWRPARAGSFRVGRVYGRQG
jgi:hypothetical protein